MSCVYHIDVAVHFMKSRYVVVENNGAVQLVLVLTKPSSTEITVEIMNNDITATGMSELILLL